MKHIGQTLLAAAILAWAGSAAALSTFSYDCGCSKNNPNPSDGCLVTEKLCALKTSQSPGGTVRYSLVLGYDRSKQVEVVIPEFACNDSYTFNNGEAICTKSNPDGSSFPDGSVPAIATVGKVKVTKGPVLNDNGYSSEISSLDTLITSLAAQQNYFSEITVSANTLDFSTLGYPYLPTCGPAYEPACSGMSSDSCNIRNFIDASVAKINAISGNIAKITNGSQCAVKFNGNADDPAVKPLLQNLMALKVALDVGAPLSACAATLEATPNFNSGVVMQKFGQLAPYVQKYAYCSTANPPADNKVACSGTLNPNSFPFPSDTVLLTVAPDNDATLKTTLADKYDTTMSQYACYLEVLKDLKVNVYTTPGTTVVQQDQKPANNALDVKMCQTTIFDCAHMVKVGDGKANAQDKPMMFLINGGKYNQLIWVLDNGSFFMVDPMNLKKFLVCKSDDAMLGMGRNEDGSSKYVAWIDSVNGKSRVRVANRQIVTVLKKVLNDHGVSIDKLMQDDQNNIPQPACDFGQYLKDAGLQDADLALFPDLPADANTIGDGAIMDDKLALLIQDKTDNTGVMKGVAIYDFSGAAPALNYQQLPAPYFNQPKSTDRTVARSLKDGVELVMVKESDGSAVRCVLPTSGGINCGPSDVKTASKTLLAGIFDKAKRGVKDETLVTQLYFMAQPADKMQAFAALMGNIDLTNTTQQLKDSLDAPDKALDAKGDFLQAIAGAIFHKIEGYGEVSDVIVPLSESTILMRKAEGKLYPEIVDAFPGASNCVLADVDNMAGPDLVCMGTGNLFSVPKTNLPPVWSQTNVLGTGKLELEPKYKSQEGEDHHYLWKLEQKVGEQWVDQTGMLSDPAAEKPTLSVSSTQAATPLGAVKGVTKSIATGSDALNNAIFRSTVTITDPGGLKSVGVNTFSVSAKGEPVVIAQGTPEGAAVPQGATIPGVTAPQDATAVSDSAGGPSLQMQGGFGCSVTSSGFTPVSLLALGLLLLPILCVVPVRAKVRRRK